MDGPWQIGHRSADDYGKLAARTASAMRQFDPELELVVCGSSSADMPTFGEWERVVLTHTYDHVDYISCHAYYQERNGDLASFLASATDMDRFIEAVVATADHVKAVRGSDKTVNLSFDSDKTVNLSFDEWNVRYLDRFGDVDKIQGTDNWPQAPRLLEDHYSVADAVVVGSLLITLLTHADRVTSASLAQLVNVIAPIMTEPGGPAWRQTTFYPFALTARLAIGSALSVHLESDTHQTDVYGVVAVVDAVATHDSATGRSAVFLVNRSQDEDAAVTIDLSALGGVSVLEASMLSDDTSSRRGEPNERESVRPATAQTPRARTWPTVGVPGRRRPGTIAPAGPAFAVTTGNGAP
ncbi:alpha-L-arabinofuranosidase [Nakamurella sp. UYEF19]